MGQHSAGVPAWSQVPAPYEHLVPELPAVRRLTVDQVVTGCVIDGACGWHAGPRAIELAVDHGWPISPEDRRALDAYVEGDWDHGQAVSEMVDEVTTWLTDNIAPDGYLYEWVDGDLMLWSVGASCEASGDRCFCVEPHASVA